MIPHFAGKSLGFLWRWWLAVALASCLAVFWGTLMRGSTHPPTPLSVVMLDVFGDALLVETPLGAWVMVDGGQSPMGAWQLARVSAGLRQTLDALVVTHGDADHAGGALWVARHFGVPRLIITGTAGKAAMDAVVQTVQRSGGAVEVVWSTEGDFVLGGAHFDVVWPRESLAGKAPKDSNNAGMVLRVCPEDHRSGEKCMLLTADIGARAEKAMLAQGLVQPAAVLKVGHHGSKTSSTADFLAAVSPEVAIITASQQSADRYNHPHPSVVSRLVETGAKVYISRDSAGAGYRVSIPNQGEITATELPFSRIP